VLPEREVPKVEAGSEETVASEVAEPIEEEETEADYPTSGPSPSKI